MLPTLFSIEAIGTTYRLYTGEIITTSEALAVFSPSEPIEVTEFEASLDKGKGWVSKKNLPPLKSVEEMRNFINANDNLELIDFTGTISGNSTLSTHDDGEASFLVSNQDRALVILRSLADKRFLNEVQSAVVNNPGKYIYIPKDTVKIFNTFDEWRANDERPQYS
jgi:hypothetical protein